MQNMKRKQVIETIKIGFFPIVICIAFCVALFTLCMP